MKKLIKSFLFFIVTVLSFAMDGGIGVLVSEKYGKELEGKLNLAIKEEFQGEKNAPQVKEVQYFSGNNYNEKFKKLDANNEVSVIFVLDYENRKIDANTEKLVVYPFGIEGKQGVNTSSKIEIQGVLPVEEDLKELKKLRDIKKVTYLLPQEKMRGNGEFVQNLKVAAEKTGLTSEVLDLNTSVETLKVKFQGTDAVYIISNGEAKDVLNLGKEMNKLTYLVDFGGSEKNLSLVGQNLEVEKTKRIRTAVYSYYNRIFGKEANTIVDLGKLSGKRYFNLSQGKGQNVYPSKEFMSKYEAIGNTTKAEAPKLTLQGAIKYGLDNNQELRAAFNRANSTDYKYLSTFAKRLPQVYGELDYSYLESNALNSYTQSHENTTTGGIKISQVIFNSDLNAEIFSQKMKSKNAELQFRNLTDRTIQVVINAYLGVIQDQSKLNIARNNYEMLQEFLKISRLKYETGSVGIQDVYRFEAEVATAEGELAREEANFANSKYNLNKILSLKPDTKHTFETTEELSKVFSTDIYPIETMSYNAMVRDIVTEYLTKGALEKSYSIKIADNNLLDIDNRYKSVRNSRFIPQVEGYAKYNKDNIGASGASIDSSTTSDRQEEYWNGGIGVKLPIFTSGEILFKQKSLDAEREAVTNEKNNAIQEIERLMNTELSRMLGSYSEYVSSNVTKNASKKYLDIVVNQYKIGSIGITDLLEAKNTYIKAENANVVSNYNFYNSLVGVEKTYGEFIFMKDAGDKKRIKNEIDSLIKN